MGGDGHGSQRGLMLLELVIGLAIVSIVSTGIVMSVFQLTAAARQADEQQYVTTQLRTAELWISRDAMMAVRISETGFPLRFGWDVVDGTPQVLVTYNLDATTDGYRLRRDVNRVGVLETLIVAEGIDAGASSYLYAPYTLTVTLVASRGNVTESCTFEVQPRTTGVEIMP